MRLIYAARKKNPNMLRLIKKQLLKNKQAYLSRRYPGVQITLHQDMVGPSISKMVEVASLVSQVVAYEDKISKLSDTELKAKTFEFREHIAKKSQELSAQFLAIEESLSTVAIPEEKERLKEKLKISRNRVFQQILPEAFAVVREASKRSTGLRHFDVQIAGGIILHEGRIAEMATGEGKTLVATLPTYLNALLGKGVHIITVNDYLARRDREWMGPIYEFLGLSVGVVQHDMSDEDRQRAYRCDITYGTNNEFGFDYLRDNMKYSLEDLVQRPFYYAIVDEVDSILIDEARTPLIISGPAEESTEKYYTIDRIIPKLKGRMILEKEEIEAKFRNEDLSAGYDYIVDEKAHTAHLTEDGEAKVCKHLGIQDMHSMETMDWRHHVNQALRAHNLYKNDVDYVIKEGQVLIVDEFTGRLMPGRRWSDGLHQAVEAKEGLKIERENQTLATVTFQNYFRMYEKLAGMTGTALTEANEFKSIYKLDVVTIPTNQPLVRLNNADRIYKSEREKFNAVVLEIEELYKKGQPVLVGTISIKRSELLSEMLKRKGVTHQVLNAKYHEMEAQIVAQAGRFKGVTIATNMAGRGTDILLGGNSEYMAKSLALQKSKDGESDYQAEYQKVIEQFKAHTRKEHDLVVEVGGLHVLGTERHEARRIDNQLRGRCGRQGDPGSSRFYVSLEDDLMRLFGSDRLIGIMEKLGLPEGELIEHPWISKSIEIAQRRVETHNFEIRKQLLEYDNVMNKQREIIYGQRRQILSGTSLRDTVNSVCEKIGDGIFDAHISAQLGEKEWDILGLIEEAKLRMGIEISPEILKQGPIELLRKSFIDEIIKAYEQKCLGMGSDLCSYLERMVFLQVIDGKWKEHLYAMDYLREGIGLRAYGQRDPLVEYKREAFEMFSQMISTIEEEAAEILFKLQPVKPDRMRGVFSSISQNLSHPEVVGFSPPNQEVTPQASLQSPSPQVNSTNAAKAGRNDPCPCGSGKKYKKCCGV